LYPLPASGCITIKRRVPSLNIIEGLLKTEGVPVVVRYPVRGISIMALLPIESWCNNALL